MIELDFTGSSDSETTFEALEPGVYPAHIYNITKKVGVESGKPYLAFEFNLDSTENPSLGKRRAWDNYSLQPQALWKLRDLLKHFGYGTDELKGRIDFDPNEWKGKPVDLVLGPAEDGSSLNPVVDVYPRGEAPENSGSTGAAW